DLDDPVAAGVGEALDRGVHRLRRGDVDRRVREALSLRPVEHLGVHLWGGDGHVRPPTQLAYGGTRGAEPPEMSIPHAPRHSDTAQRPSNGSHSGGAALSRVTVRHAPGPSDTARRTFERGTR